MNLRHALLALQAVTSREVAKFVRQGGRFASALVRPMLWLVVFAAGFQNVFGVSIIPPYDTYIPYQTYIVPGLLGMVLLFNGMQSSLAMVYDREMGVMRLLLTAPLPRAYLLFAKLLAGTLLSVLQAYAFQDREAVRAFKAALAQDPSCAMCAWGVAWQLGPNINDSSRDDVPEADEGNNAADVTVRVRS